MATQTGRNLQAEAQAIKDYTFQTGKPFNPNDPQAVNAVHMKVYGMPAAGASSQSSPTQTTPQSTDLNSLYAQLLQKQINQPSYTQQYNDIYQNSRQATGLDQAQNTFQQYMNPANGTTSDAQHQWADTFNAVNDAIKSGDYAKASALNDQLSNLSGQSESSTRNFIAGRAASQAALQNATQNFGNLESVGIQGATADRQDQQQLLGTILSGIQEQRAQTTSNLQNKLLQNQITGNTPVSKTDQLNMAVGAIKDGITSGQIDAKEGLKTINDLLASGGASSGSSGSNNYTSIVPGFTKESQGFGVPDVVNGKTVEAHHSGIDLAAPAGSPIQSFVGGTVISAAPNGGFGNMVIVKGTDGNTYSYGHMAGFAVKPGDTVQAGQVLGQVGSTGQSTGPHVHFRVQDAQGKLINPDTLFQGSSTAGGGPLGGLLSGSATSGNPMLNKPFTSADIATIAGLAPSLSASEIAKYKNFNQLIKAHPELNLTPLGQQPDIKQKAIANTGISAADSISGALFNTGSTTPQFKGNSKQLLGTALTIFNAGKIGPWLPFGADAQKLANDYKSLLFNYVYAMSGAQYSDSQLTQFASMLPGPGDTADSAKHKLDILLSPLKGIGASAATPVASSGNNDPLGIL